MQYRANDIRLAAIRLEERLVPAASLALVSPADPARLSDTPGGDSFTAYQNAVPKPTRLFSDDGRFFLFTSSAANLIAGQIDANNSYDVFLSDRQLGTTALVSRASGTVLQTGSRSSINPSMSGDGRYVVYESQARDLVAEFVNGGLDYVSNVFLFDRIAGTTRLVSHDAAAPLTGGNDSSSQPLISRDGSMIAFVSEASTLVAGSFIMFSDVFVQARAGGEIKLLSRGFLAPLYGTGLAKLFDISDDGSRVLYHAQAAVFGQPYSGAGLGLGNTTTLNGHLIGHHYANPLQGADGSVLQARFAGGGHDVAFASSSTNLIQGASDGKQNIYWHDSATDMVSLISASATSPNVGGNGDSLAYQNLAVSDDGRYVAFESQATNLVAGFVDRNGAQYSDIYLRDLLLATTTLVSHAPNLPNEGAASNCTDPTIADGRRIAFLSSGTDLVVGVADGNQPAFPVNGSTDVLVFDRATGLNRLVSMSASAANRSGDHISYLPRFDPTGNTIVFESKASDLIANLNDFNSNARDGVGRRDLFAADAPEFAPTLLSTRGGGVSSSGGGHSRLNLATGQNHTTNDPELSSTSSDGRIVVVTSQAPNIAPHQHDTNNETDVFTYDRRLGATVLVSHAHGDPNRAANGYSSRAGVAGEGRYVVYQSTATDLIPGFIDGNGATGGDTYLYDRVTGLNTLVSHVPGQPLRGGNGTSMLTDSGIPVSTSVSDDGRWVAVLSRATDLVAGFLDTIPANKASRAQVYLFDRLSGEVTLVTHAVGSTSTGGNRGAGSARISGDGSTLVYRTDANNLMNLAYSHADGGMLYSRDIASGVVRLVSHQYAEPLRFGLGYVHTFFRVSTDGRRIAFSSPALNLTLATFDGQFNVYLYDSVTDESRLVSHVDGDPSAPTPIGDILRDMSADGNTVIFASSSTGVVPGFVDHNGTSTSYVEGLDLYRYDATAQVNTLVSRRAGTTSEGANRQVGEASTSGDGRFVAYVSLASNHVSGFTGEFLGLTSNGYLYDAVTGATTLITHAVDDPLKSGNRSSFVPTLTRDGSAVVIESDADNLVPNDFNGFWDMFVLANAPPRLVSPPTINDGSSQRSSVRSITVAFDQPVTFVGPPESAFTLSKSGGGAVAVAATVSYDTRTVITLTFSGPLTEFGSLSDGDYTLRISAAAVLGFANLDGNGDGVAGDDYISPAGLIFRLFGDADGNRSVNQTDFGAFRLGLGSNMLWFDADGDGDVDLRDFLAFRMRFGTALP